MLHKNRGRKGRFVVQSTASIGVAARANLKVEGTIDFVFFCAVNSSQVLGHFEKLTVNE